MVGSVLDKYLKFYTENKVQPYGASEICHVAGEQMDAGRQTMANLLGVDMESITIGPSTTQNINTLAVACASIIDRNSTVIVSGQDHEANIGAWERLCDRTGAKLKIWEIVNNAELNISSLEPLIDSSVKVICMTHSSNIVGKQILHSILPEYLVMDYPMGLLKLILPLAMGIFTLNDYLTRPVFTIVRTVYLELVSPITIQILRFCG